MPFFSYTRINTLFEDYFSFISLAQIPIFFNPFRIGGQTDHVDLSAFPKNNEMIRSGYPSLKMQQGPFFPLNW